MVHAEDKINTFSLKKQTTKTPTTKLHNVFVTQAFNWNFENRLIVIENVINYSLDIFLGKPKLA